MNVSSAPFPRNFSPAFADMPSHVSEFLSRDAASLPGSDIIKQRNTALDWLFYDVASLTTDEFQSLSIEDNKEGTIIVVHPFTRERETCVRKFNSYRELRAASGDLLQHFCIAGVGSSDVGAAALARNLANVCDAPVGAIVAGYGVADLLTEALGGWFFLGASNRMMKAFHAHEARIKRTLAGLENTVVELDASTAAQVAASLTGNPDSDVLLRLLLDEDRQIHTLLGHSKGCLSIAYALQALVLTGRSPEISKAKEIELVTTGAVVEFPNEFLKVTQYLGSVDWFGGMNSQLSNDHICIPGAWHHLNTMLPLHLSVEQVLTERPQGPSCLLPLFIR